MLCCTARREPVHVRSAQRNSCADRWRGSRRSHRLGGRSHANRFAPVSDAARAAPRHDRPARAREAARGQIPQRRVRRYRGNPVPDGRDDRPAPGRAARTALARRRRHRPQGTRRLALRPRRVRRSEVRGLGAVGSARRSCSEELQKLRDHSVYDADGDLVFCHPESGGLLDRSKLTRRFKQTIKLTEVREITFHELRHTFGTRMAAAGVPLRTIQHWMGHADAKTTQVYAHYQPSDHEADTVDQAFSAERRASRTPTSARRRSPRRAGSSGRGRRGS
jgi:hypothetical protein